MALRVRSDGRIVCAAQYPERMDDRLYIDDGLHYALACHFRAEETERDQEWAEAYQLGSTAMEAWRQKYPEERSEA